MADTWTTKTAAPTTRGQMGGGQCSVGSDTAYLAGGKDGTDTLGVNEEYSQSGDSWTTKSSIPSARQEYGVSAIGTDKLYCIAGYNAGGSNNNQEYSKSGNSWASKTNYPTSSSDLVAAAPTSGKLYCVDDNNTREYSQAGDSWAAKANAGFGQYYRYQTIFTPESGRLNVANGLRDISASPYLTTDHKQYDPSSDTWVAKADVITFQAGGGNGQVSGKGYLYGGGEGAGGAGPDLRSTHYYTREYDPSSDTWASGANMPDQRMWMGSAPLGPYRLYALCGHRDGFGYYNTNYEYTAADPPPQTALEDLKSFADARYPEVLEDLKSYLVAWKYALEDLKADVRAAAFDALEDLKAELAGHAWAFTELKSQAIAYGDTLTDLKTGIATSNQVYTDLKCELKTLDKAGPYIVRASLTPQPGETGVPVNSNIVIKIRDDGWGVDVDAVWVEVTDTMTSTTTRYKKGDGGFSYTLSVDKKEAVITVNPSADFEYDRNIQVRVFGADLAGNPGLVAK